MKHSNQDYPKIASNFDNTKSYADGWTIFTRIINYGLLTHAKKTLNTTTCNMKKT